MNPFLEKEDLEKSKNSIKLVQTFRGRKMADQYRQVHLYRDKFLHFLISEFSKGSVF